MAVRPRRVAVEQRRDRAATTASASSGDSVALPACATGDVAHARSAVRGARAVDDLALEAGSGSSRPVVEHLRGERADVRVEPPRLGRGTARGRPAIVGRAAEDVPERAPLRARRVAALEGWSSCCGSPSSTSDARRRRAPRARWRARSGPPRRRTARRRTPAHVRAGPQPRRAADDVDRRRASAATHLRVRRRAQRAVAQVGCSSVARASARCGPATPRLAGRRGDLVQQVADHLVAVRGDADLLPAAHERHDHLRARIGLARARRPLDRQDRPSSASAEPDARRRAASRRAAASVAAGPHAVAAAARSSRSRAAASAVAALVGIDPVCRDPLADRRRLLRCSFVGTTSRHERRAVGAPVSFAGRA